MSSDHSIYLPDRELKMDNTRTPLMPFVGEESLESLKKTALMADKVALAFLTSIPRARRARFPLTIAYYDDSQIRRVSTELNLLSDHGLLDIPAQDPIASGFEMEGFDDNLPVWVVRKSSGTRFFQPNQGSFDKKTIELSSLTSIMAATPELGFARAQSNNGGSPIVMDTTLLQFHAKAAQPDNQGRVLDLVLNNVPQPGPDTPWEAIFDWRNDEEAKIKFRRLKHWVNKTSERTDLNPDHLKDEVLYLLDEYQQYMKIQNAKFSASTLRTIITGTAEVIESLAKLNFKALADMPFKINEVRLAIREAELTAPGRELAYIIDARESFK
ncbi:hypothetical protein [Pseudomonas putida]|uniref:hypothetical protein n=1 Tax=Pseudomonas putida TaxID=303 RepID=UPI00300F3463